MSGGPIQAIKRWLEHKAATLTPAGKQVFAVIFVFCLGVVIMLFLLLIRGIFIR